MWVMANRHFGKLSDVWKHAAVAASWLNGHGVYPGSALLAMTVLGDASSYLLCDLDPGSAADLRRWAHELSLRGCQVAQADGMAAVAAWLDGDAGTPGLVHIDPFDPDARSPAGYSASELAARVADSGTRLVYWYGYDQPSEQARMAVQTHAPLWCGDVMVTGTSSTAGDLGRATTPGTGFGVILANVQADTVGACMAVGNALADAYSGAPLPDRSEGNPAFTTRTNGRTA
jgi:hypothetical protein